MTDRRVLVPLLTGAVAVVLGAVLVVWAFRAPSTGEPRTTGQQATVTLSARPLVDRAGGFRTRVPQGLHGRLDGHTAVIASRDRSVLVLIAPSRSGRLARTNAAIVRAMHDGYRHVRVLGQRRERVDGRPGLSTFGTAVNHAGVHLRWVQLTVRARPRNLTVATYTRSDTDPHWVVPRVNVVVNGLRLLRG
ncbi:MAG TPA: hypothetical protein VFM09_11645 [Marmoricola sp.]|nr:hypothetical protein [Marmoricola sp.]